VRRRSLSAAVGALMRLLGSRSAAAAAAGLGALRPASLYDSYRRPHYYPDKTGSSLAGDSPSLPSVELPPPAPAQASSVAVARSTPAGAATVVSHALEGPLHAAPARQAEARALAAAAGEEPAQLRTELGATVNLTLQRRLRRHATGEAPLPPMDLLAYVGTLRLAAARLRQAGCPAAAADLEAIVAHHSPPDPLNEEQWASFSDFSRLAADFERELKGGPFPAGGAAGGDRSWRSPAERHAAVQLTAAQRDAARRVYAQDEFELAGDETRCDWSAPAPPPACSLRLAGRGGAASAAEQIIAAKAASDDEAAKKPWLLPRVRAAAQAAVRASAAGQTGSAGQPAGTAAATAWAAQWAADNRGASPALLATVQALAQREFSNAFLAAAAGAELAAAAQAAAERRAVAEMTAAEIAAVEEAEAQATAAQATADEDAAEIAAAAKAKVERRAAKQKAAIEKAAALKAAEEEAAEEAAAEREAAAQAAAARRAAKQKATAEKAAAREAAAQQAADAERAAAKAAAAASLAERIAEVMAAFAD
jgi:flagellar biosynthesis GTPase FlhF